MMFLNKSIKKKIILNNGIFKKSPKLWYCINLFCQKIHEWNMIIYFK